MTKTSILNTIAEQKMKEVANSKKTSPISSFEYHIPIRDFIVPLQQEGIQIIAEIKKASPSKGIICPNFNVPNTAKIYQQAGASCLSVLTDVQFFQGHNDYIRIAKNTCTLPILRKEFIVDAYQIYESRWLGADCILLIVALLDDYQLREFCHIAQSLGMSVLVESHSKEELLRAVQLPTPLIGINNRDLHTFSIDIAHTIELLPYVPSDKIVISESGIHSNKEIKTLLEAGVNHFLIGESLMASPNTFEALQDLLSPL